jgi:hypothetical protein
MPSSDFFRIKLATKLTRVARFILVQHTKTGKNIPNNHKIYRHLPFIDPLKFTQIGIFGLKIHMPFGNPEADCQLSFGVTNLCTTKIIPRPSSKQH